MYSYSLKIKICNEKPFFGPGSIMLLEAINATGSLYQACENMNLSYTKGRKMINDIKTETGHAAVEIKHGGTGGGQAKLTEHGLALLNTYKNFIKEAEDSINKIFTKYYG